MANPQSFLPLFLVVSPVAVRRHPSKATEGREGSLCLHCEGSSPSWWKVMVVGSHTMRLLPVHREAEGADADVQLTFLFWALQVPTYLQDGSSPST